MEWKLVGKVKRALCGLGGKLCQGTEQHVWCVLCVHFLLQSSCSPYTVCMPSTHLKCGRKLEFIQCVQYPEFVLYLVWCVVLCQLESIYSKVTLLLL